MPKRTLGVVIGRFQIDQLHDGHLRLIDHVIALNDAVLVLVGDRNSPPTAENPLSFAIRKEMIEEEFGEVQVMAMMDHPSNKIWSYKLDGLLTTVKNGGQYDSVTLYCGRDGFAPHYQGSYPVEVQSFGIDGESATARRKYIAEEYRPLDDFDENSITFRRGIIYAMQHLPHRTYLTVDIACTRGENGEMEVCMAQRQWETDVWRLPGGFVEAGESFKTAARREFQEETSAWIEGVNIVGDFPIKDWRLRGVSSVSHKTILCHGSGWGNIQGADDIARTEWVNIHDLIQNPSRIVDEHREMFLNGLVPYLQSKGLL
jgi:ADP-ribose pyrophosphatase YjhB (NUDIX family)/nicotinamide mononucleotide adenylyltransferase